MERRQPETASDELNEAYVQMLRGEISSQDWVKILQRSVSEDMKRMSPRLARPAARGYGWRAIRGRAQHGYARLMGRSTVEVDRKLAERMRRKYGLASEQEAVAHALKLVDG